MTTGTGQNLLKRNPSLTPIQFSDHWYNDHAKKVIPYFIDMGVVYYAQIHGPLTISTTTNTDNLPQDLVLADYDGAAELSWGPNRKEDSAKSQDYYRKVILADEKRFLVSPALEHLVRVDDGTVAGDKRVLIENGKACVEFDEDAKIWDEWVVDEGGEKQSS